MSGAIPLGPPNSPFENLAAYKAWIKKNSSHPPIALANCRDVGDDARKNIQGVTPPLTEANAIRARMDEGERRIWGSRITDAQQELSHDKDIAGLSERRLNYLSDRVSANVQLESDGEKAALYEELSSATREYFLQQTRYESSMKNYGIIQSFYSSSQNTSAHENVDVNI